MLEFHKRKDIIFAELPSSERIDDADALLDLMADARYNDSGIMLIHSESLPEGFTDLKTGLAGEILQKFSNYRMKLAIIGDFTSTKSKSLNDFIRESNRTGRIIFVGNVEEAIGKLTQKA